MEEKAHSLNMATLANRQSAAQLCAQLAAGQRVNDTLQITASHYLSSAAERKVGVELQARWEAGVRVWRDAVFQDTLAKFK